MKKALLLLNLALLSVISNATSLNGIIYNDQTLTKANSPYIVDGNLLVNKNAKLTIEPGVEIKVNQNVLFYIDGALDAVGTPAEPIRFFKNYSGADRWGGIQCRDSNATAAIKLSYCEADGGLNFLKTWNRIVNVTNCKFTNNYFALWLIGGQVNVTNSKFSDNIVSINTERNFGTIANNEVNAAGEGIHSNNIAGRLEITGNRVDKCNVGINIYFGGVNDSVLVTDNNVTNFNNEGMRISDMGVGTVCKNNIFAFGDKGVGFSNVKGKIYNNTIKNVNRGVVVAGVPDYIPFENNCVDSIKMYIVLNTTTTNVTMKQNYWGETDSVVMHDKTYDYYDDFKSGKIYYGTFLQSTDVSCQMVTPQNPTSIPDSKTDKPVISAYPNPFTSAFTIEINGTQATASAIEIYNTVGVKIISSNISTESKITIDLANYPAGIYLYKVLLSDHTSTTGKLYKQ